jgi:hypothetical protein
MIHIDDLNDKEGLFEISGNAELVAQQYATLTIKLMEMSKITLMRALFHLKEVPEYAELQRDIFKTKCDS